MRNLLMISLLPALDIKMRDMPQAADIHTTIDILKHNVHELQSQLQEAYIKISQLTDENESLSSLVQRDQLLDK